MNKTYEIQYRLKLTDFELVLSIVFRKFVSDKMKLRTGIPVMERLRSA